jgi:hypothetical protein
MSIKKVFLILIFAVLLNGNANAQIKIEKRFKMWESQFTEEASNKVCFAVSVPTKMSPANLNRAESRIFVTFRPKDGVSNEISVTNGYPFGKKSNVNVNVGNAQFKFETKGNFAWMTSLDEELKMIRAMKKANKAEVIGISSRGNKTRDTYSMIGFTDAYNAARKNCKN